MKKIVNKIIEWLATTESLIFFRNFLGKIFYRAIFYNDPERLNIMALSRRIKKDQTMVLSDLEAYQVYMAVERTSKLDGDIAEVGVFKGGSAKLICEAKGEKVLHLFDTFEGLPDICEMDDPEQVGKGQCLSSFETVKKYLEKYPYVYIYKGIFPSTADPVKNKRFSFVNLDVDLYESTLNCLEFFYYRMNAGGIIISHDYTFHTGVKKAIDGFFEEKPEPVISLAGSQCLIVKC